MLELAVLLLLGSALTTSGLSEPGLAGWLLAPLLLLVIRPAAALLALVGSGIAPGERLFVAWFGVKGVAALNYAVVAAASGLLGDDAPAVLWTAIACVIVSIRGPRDQRDGGHAAAAAGLTADRLARRRSGQVRLQKLRQGGAWDGGGGLQRQLRPPPPVPRLRAVPARARRPRSPAAPPA